ncbi:hypothetical protein [Verrucomicrobium spinosum]|nr:hypothetical protein [Verrucomicrobium spinosum]
MQFSSKPSHRTVNRPLFSVVTVNGSPATKVLTTQSGRDSSTVARVTR